MVYCQMEGMDGYLCCLIVSDTEETCMMLPDASFDECTKIKVILRVAHDLGLNTTELTPALSENEKEVINEYINLVTPQAPSPAQMIEPTVTPDTDGDGVADSLELNVHGTDPLKDDTDEDSLSDYDELFVHYTNASNPDTDGGGISDGEEVMNLIDPLDSSEEVVTSIDYSFSVPHDSAASQEEVLAQVKLALESATEQLLSDETKGLQALTVSNGLKILGVEAYASNGKCVVFSRVKSCMALAYFLTETALF